MNLSDSKKKLVLAGVVCGIVAACLATLGNPANMAFCIACFIRDTAGAMGVHPVVHLLFTTPTPPEKQEARLPASYLKKKKI